MPYDKRVRFEGDTNIEFEEALILKIKSPKTSEIIPDKLPDQSALHIKGTSIQSKLFLNPRERSKRIGGGTSRTIKMSKEQVLMCSMATYYDIYWDSDKEKYNEQKQGVGFLYLTNKRLLFEIKPTGLMDNYAFWMAHLSDVTEVRSTRTRSRFGGGLRKRLQIRHRGLDGKILTVNFLSARIGGGFLRSASQLLTGSFLKRTLVPKDWENAILRYIFENQREENW